MLKETAQLVVSRMEIQGKVCQTPEGSLAHIVNKVWNNLPFPADRYETLEAFTDGLESLDWTKFDFVMDALHNYSSFCMLAVSQN